jgi:hypothetical protein
MLILDQGIKVLQDSIEKYAYLREADGARPGDYIEQLEEAKAKLDKLIFDFSIYVEAIESIAVHHLTTEDMEKISKLLLRLKGNIDGHNSTT